MDVYGMRQGRMAAKISTTPLDPGASSHCSHGCQSSHTVRVRCEKNLTERVLFLTRRGSHPWQDMKGLESRVPLKASD